MDTTPRNLAYVPTRPRWQCLTNEITRTETNRNTKMTLIFKSAHTTDIVCRLQLPHIICCCCGSKDGSGLITSPQVIRGSFFIAYSTMNGMKPYRTPVMAQLRTVVAVSQMAELSSERFSSVGLRSSESDGAVSVHKRTGAASSTEQQRAAAMARFR